MLGQRASSQMVCRERSWLRALRSVKLGPRVAFTLSQSGFFSKGISLGRRWRRMDSVGMKVSAISPG